jgi:hypothetical protein
MASRRTGHRERHAEGRYFWIHPLRPGVCFPTRKDALYAAVDVVAGKPIGART